MCVLICITVFLLVHVCIFIYFVCGRGVYVGCVCLQVGCGGEIAHCWVYNMQLVLVVWVLNLFADETYKL